MSMLYGRTERVLFIARLALGWFFLYAGWTKIINDAWTAAPYLLSAKTLPALYQLLANPSVLPFTNFINKWGLFLLGISLLTGIWVRLSAPLGAALMLLYYLPILDFPYVGHGLIVDEHLIYILLLIAFWTQSEPFRLNEPIRWVKRLALSAKKRKLAAL